MGKKRTFTIFDLGYPVADAAATQDEKHSSRLTRDKKIASYLATLTKRQLEMFLDDCANVDYLAPLPHRAAEDSPLKSDYLRAYYGKCWKSPSERKAFDFLRVCYGRAIWDKESGRRRKDNDWLLLVKPLLDAVNELDEEFFKGLTKAVQILKDRIYSCKDPNMGVGDTSLNKWLLEYRVQNGGHAVHTARELNERFVSKFRKISDAKLRQKCGKLGVALKKGRRGRPAKRKISTP